MPHAVAVQCGLGKKHAGTTRAVGDDQQLTPRIQIGVQKDGLERTGWQPLLDEGGTGHRQPRQGLGGVGLSIEVLRLRDRYPV